MHIQSDKKISANTNFFYGFGSLFNLINHSFWRGIFGPFFTFLFPLIFIAILGSLLGYDQILGGAFIIGPMAISLVILPTTIFEFKNSSLLKRIGSTPVKPLLFLFTIGFYYVIVMIISLIWSFLVSLVIFIQYWDVGRVIREAIDGGAPAILAPSFSEVLKMVNWGGFVWGQLMSILVGAGVGIALSSYAKSSIMIIAFGTMIMISSQFLTAQVLPPYMVKDVDVMWYGGYVLSPWKAPTSIVLESWNGSATVTETGIEFLMSNPFDLNNPWVYFDPGPPSVQKTILASYEKWLNMFLPFIWFIGLTLLSAKKFGWSTRS